MPEWLEFLGTIGFIGLLGETVRSFIKRYFYYGQWKFGGYPQVAGTYIASYKDGVFPDGELAEDPNTVIQPEQINMKQRGGRVWGTIHDPNNNTNFRFTGNVTPTRVLTYQYRPEDPSTLDSYGAGLLKLDREGKILTGHLVLLRRKDRSPTAVAYTYERIA